MKDILELEFEEAVTAYHWDSGYGDYNKEELGVLLENWDSIMGIGSMTFRRMSFVVKLFNQFLPKHLQERELNFIIIEKDKKPRVNDNKQFILYKYDDVDFYEHLRNHGEFLVATSKEVLEQWQR